MGGTVSDILRTKSVGGDNGAPNLLEYINYKELANVLIDTWDNGIYHKTKDNKIVCTLYGW